MLNNITGKASKGMREYGFLFLNASQNQIGKSETASGFTRER
ncbi:MAG: hypothetical protein ABH879_05150 [archaeon]